MCSLVHDIHCTARPRVSGLPSRSVPDPYFDASRTTMAFDSHMTTPPSSTTGTVPLGFMDRYHGASTPP